MNKSNYSPDFYKGQLDYAKKAFEAGNMFPRRYVFILTNLCNLACSICFQERKKRSDRMSFDNWLVVINQKNLKKLICISR